MWSLMSDSALKIYSGFKVEPWFNFVYLAFFSTSRSVQNVHDDVVLWILFGDLKKQHGHRNDGNWMLN